MLVWVTGTSGAGKSSVCDALRARGATAVDADWDGYSFWVDRLDGEVVTEPPYPVPRGWLDRYSWRINRARVEELALQSQGGVSFLCGSVENEREVWDLFDRVICLIIDDETLTRRLAARTTNAFGKQREELRAAIGWNHTVEGIYRGRGAAIIDATRPIETVVNDVLAAIRERR